MLLIYSLEIQKIRRYFSTKWYNYCRYIFHFKWVSNLLYDIHRVGEEEKITNCRHVHLSLAKVSRFELYYDCKSKILC